MRLIKRQLSGPQRVYHFKGNKGPRVLSDYMRWFLERGAKSRQQLKRSRFYQPHHNAKECDRRVRQRINGTHGL